MARPTMNVGGQWPVSFLFLSPDRAGRQFKSHPLTAGRDVAGRALHDVAWDAVALAVEL